MKALNGYSEAKATTFGDIPKLEPGGYILKILNVKEEQTNWGTTRIALQFDVEEGENKGIFKKIYDATPDEWENKKWKGAHRLNVPQDKGDGKYLKALGFFKSQIEAFEKSNNGLFINCSTDWDVSVLKGKLVGAIFNEKEWEMNGNKGFFTQCKRLVPAETIRSGKFTVPKPDMLDKSSDLGATASDFVEIEDDGVPF